MKLFVGNLPYVISEPELHELFACYGEVVSIKLILDPFSGHPKGFAFVEMGNRSEGHKAMESLNKSQFKDRQLVCNEARPPRKGGRRR